MKKFLTLSFLPALPDFGLLLLRVWLGLSMAIIHGWDKLANFGATVEAFGKMGFPSFLAAPAILAETLCAVFLVVGFATRWSALFLVSTMAVAFFKVHQMVLKPGAGSGELAFIYLAGFLAILLAGPGRHSVDAKLLK